MFELWFNRSTPLTNYLNRIFIYKPRSSNKGVYLRKCITQHEDQYNCFIPYDILVDFRKFERCFNEKFPNEPKISVRYILYRIVQLYEHQCLETTFI